MRYDSGQGSAFFDSSFGPLPYIVNKVPSLRHYSYVVLLMKVGCIVLPRTCVTWRSVPLIGSQSRSAMALGLESHVSRCYLRDGRSCVTPRTPLDKQSRAQKGTDHCHAVY